MLLALRVRNPFDPTRGKPFGPDWGMLLNLTQFYGGIILDLDTRAKSNLQFNRVYSHHVEKSLGLICDQSIYLTGFYPSKDYPEKLRRIKYFDPETNKRLTFITNNFSLPAITIAKLYKQRWQIELFFKWIKHNLRIKSFYGNSFNAVKTQIWIAISVYVLLAIIAVRLSPHS